MLGVGGFFCEWTSFDGGWPSMFYIGWYTLLVHVKVLRYRVSGFCKTKCFFPEVRVSRIYILLGTGYGYEVLHPAKKMLWVKKKAY